MAAPFADVRIDANGVKSGADFGDEMEIMMLGAGVSTCALFSCLQLTDGYFSQQEVGRSCCVIKYKGATVVCDAGSHPAYQGLPALPCGLFYGCKGYMLSLFFSCNVIDSSTSWTGLPLMRFSSLSPFALCCSCCFSLCFLFFCLAFMWIMLLRCHMSWKRCALF